MTLPQIINDILQLKCVESIKLESKSIDPKPHFHINVNSNDASEFNLVEIQKMLNNQKEFNWTLNIYFL